MVTQIWKIFFSAYSNYSCSKYFSKNNWKQLKFILENNFFLKQILKKLFSIKILSNMFYKLKKLF